MDLHIILDIDQTLVDNMSMNEYENKNAELETIKACSIEQMWLKELGELKIAYKEFLESTTNNKLGEKNISKTKNRQGKEYFIFVINNI